VQQHVHPGQVVGSDILLLSVDLAVSAFFDLALLIGAFRHKWTFDLMDLVVICGIIVILSGYEREPAAAGKRDPVTDVVIGHDFKEGGLQCSRYLYNREGGLVIERDWNDKIVPCDYPRLPMAKSDSVCSQK
jgi:hypothetical protein